MPNARPTQPGYYWARLYVGHGELSWEPVNVVTEFGRLLFYVLGDGEPYEIDDAAEWGPAILEYRGEGGG